MQLMISWFFMLVSSLGEILESTTLIRLLSTPLFDDKIYTESGQIKKYFFKA